MDPKILSEIRDKSYMFWIIWNDHTSGIEWNEHWDDRCYGPFENLIDKKLSEPWLWCSADSDYRLRLLFI